MSVVVILLSLVITNLLAQVPSADECQLVNATEPPICPQQIGPPCPPCIINSASDYQEGDPLTIDESTRNLIESYMMEYLNYWPQHYPPKTILPLDIPSSIVEGAGGRGLIFLRLYNYTQNQTYLDLASEYIQSAIDQLKISVIELPSYFSGRTGVYTIAAQLAKMTNDDNKMKQYLNEIENIFNDVQTAINSNMSTSPQYGFHMEDGCIMTGLGGLLYSGMLINEYFGDNTINNEYIANISHYLLNLGLKLGSNYDANYLVYKFEFQPGCYIPGSAEGSGGVIKMLLEAYNRGYVDDLMKNDYYKAAIKNTLHWFASIQLNDGNIPTYSQSEDVCGLSYGNDSDARVQWCHGAPGFIDTMSLAAVVFDSFGDDDAAQIYLNSALRAFNATWERGLLIKGLMHCHGIGGNTNTLLHIYKNLQIIAQRNSILNVYFDVPFLMKQSLWRAIQFVKFTLDNNNLNALRTKYSNEDYSMWLGSYGIPILYIQAIQSGWPKDEPVCMIGWDFCGV